MAANAAKPKMNQIAAISFMLLPNLFVSLIPYYGKVLMKFKIFRFTSINHCWHQKETIAPRQLPPPYS